MAWPRFHSARAEPQGAKQMAAPTEPRTPNMHRAKRIAPRECEWKHGDSGHSAGRKRRAQQKETRIDLTPTGLLMEGHYTQNPYSGHSECYGDFSLTIEKCQKRPGLVARNVPSLAAHGGDAMCSKPSLTRPFRIHTLRTSLLTAGLGGLNLCSLAVPASAMFCSLRRFD